MLIRFQVKNLFSFKEETEFNLLPSRVKRLNHHKYPWGGIEILKLSAIYGANGSGKSNLIRSISLLREMLLDGIIPSALNSQKFTLSSEALNEPVELAMEFFVDPLIYYYSITINNGIVIDEYFSSNDRDQKDQLIFHRTFGDNKTLIKFFDEFEEKPENQVLKNVIEKDLIKKEQPLFTLLNSISNQAFIDIKNVFNWLEDSLIIIYPETKVGGMAESIHKGKEFKKFATELMSSFNTGIANLKVEVMNLEEFFGEDNQNTIDEIKSELKSNPKQMVSLNEQKPNGDEVVVVSENDKIVAKRLLFEHKDDEGKEVEFKLEEESDGTRRLLEYLPALSRIIYSSRTIIIDEIERSIHPLIVKEIIEKFSKDEATKGQLIFSTHESNLLDQEILRTDEIWFTEKNIHGSTKMYSLSDFSEHNTTDIRKGYLTGRYGAIPFLGNLQDLNWHKFQDEKK